MTSHQPVRRGRTEEDADELYAQMWAERFVARTGETIWVRNRKSVLGEEEGTFFFRIGLLKRRGWVSKARNGIWHLHHEPDARGRFAEPRVCPNELIRIAKLEKIYKLMWSQRAVSDDGDILWIKTRDGHLGLNIGNYRVRIAELKELGWIVRASQSAYRLLRLLDEQQPVTSEKGRKPLLPDRNPADRQYAKMWEQKYTLTDGRNVWIRLNDYQLDIPHIMFWSNMRILQDRGWVSPLVRGCYLLHYTG